MNGEGVEGVLIGNAANYVLRHDYKLCCDERVAVLSDRNMTHGLWCRMLPFLGLSTESLVLSFILCLNCGICNQAQCNKATLDCSYLSYVHLFVLFFVQTGMSRSTSLMIFCVPFEDKIFFFKARSQ